MIGEFAAVNTLERAVIKEKQVQSLHRTILPILLPSGGRIFIYEIEIDAIMI